LTLIADAYMHHDLLVLDAPCTQWRKSWGTGRNCPLQSFDRGDSSVDCPPKVKASEGHCWVLLREIS